jgi:hypothetical protein
MIIPAFWNYNTHKADYDILNGLAPTAAIAVLDKSVGDSTDSTFINNWRKIIQDYSQRAC